jgi:DnaJ-class molecular chaperone
VRIQVEVPKKMSKEERKLMLDLADRIGETRHNKDESVLRKVFGG